jgi:hypothetical protein
VRGTGADDGISFGLGAAFAVSRVGKADRERKRVYAEALSECVDRTAARAAGRAPPPESGPEAPAP